MGAEIHHSDPVHATRLRDCLPGLLRLLQTCDILGSFAGLLRGIRYCEFLHVTVPLSGTDVERAEESFSGGHAEELGLADTLVSEVLWGT